MRAKSIFTLLALTAFAFTIGGNEANAGFPAPPGLPGLPTPNVNVRVDGFLPAPPGVNVQVDSGRPYYVEQERRVYMERERPAKHTHYKKQKKHHEDNGNKYGHDKHNKHDH